MAMSIALPGAAPGATTGDRRRRDPVQERSHETVARILAATTRLLARGIAPHALTTAQIAAEASLSVGALYRFFPDKQAVVDAIALHHLEAFQEALAAGLMADVPDSPATFLAAVVDAFAAYLAAHADFLALAYGTPGTHGHGAGGRAISPAMFEQQAGGGEMADLVRDALSGLFGIEPDATFGFRLRIAAEIGDRLIGHAFAQPTPERRGRILEEAKIILTSYLFLEE